tara:strand:- start:956 stop:2038 length:1083 start_codon:yes stop_codon:yes gene_type:complete
MKFKNKNIAYLHGRLGPHIMHGRLAKGINAVFFKIDEFKKWNEGHHNKAYLIYAWIYNAFAFKNPSKFDLFLVSGPHFSPIIMKLFRLKSTQKVFVHLGDETMYFLHIKWYGKLMQKLLSILLNQYDGLLCEGQMAADLAKLNGINKPKIYTTYLGIPNERHLVLLNLKPELEANTFITIASGPSGWRTYYKGLDLMINAFGIAFQKNPTIKFTIAGDWDKDLQIKLTKNLSKECTQAITFIGHTSEIDKHLSKASFYFHTARGDAFPTVVLEAMAAGLIPVVSEWTGSKEVVKIIDESLIVKLDINDISKKLIELSEKKIDEKMLLSQKAKEISKKYTEEFALKHYQNTFDQIIKDFNL